jgi:hypothetical protein
VYYERERERERERESARTVPAPVNSLRLGAFFCKFAIELALNNFAILHNPGVRDGLAKKLTRTARLRRFSEIFFKKTAVFSPALTITLR